MAAALGAMQKTVDELLQRHAKLGEKLAVLDASGHPRMMTARYLLKQRRTEETYISAKK